MEEKEKKQFTTNIFVAIGAGLLLVALIVFIVFKVERSLKIADQSAQLTDTLTITEDKHTKKDTIVVGPDSVKLKALFAQYFKKDPIPAKYPSFLTEAFIGYDFGDYLYFKQLDFAALPETLETIDGNNRETILQLGHYYKGIASLIGNDSTQAITNLQWSINHAPAVMSTKAKWFLALTYIKLIQPNKATHLLRDVAASNVIDYNKQAKQLLGSL